jgi:hypothetical protein
MIGAGYLSQLGARGRQADRARAGRILDFPEQNRLRISWWRISLVLDFLQQLRVSW